MKEGQEVTFWKASMWGCRLWRCKDLPTSILLTGDRPPGLEGMPMLEWDGSKKDLGKLETDNFLEKQGTKYLNSRNYS